MIDFLWLEITGKCQLACGHCYASSGPDGTHGTMTADDWESVIDQAAALGVSMVQFIGGEPTLHPDLPRLVRYALAANIEVEIYSNLVHVTPTLWETFRAPGVRLATSYYTDDPQEHRAITRRPTLRATTKNIIRAREYGIPLRVGVVGALDQQRTSQGTAVLERLGVTDIGYDDLRQVGRGVRDAAPGVDQLCGRCGDRKAAISPEGEVWPCVFSRWLPAGNVLREPLLDILTGPAFTRIVTGLRDAFTSPTSCGPDSCTPRCGPSCSPACHPQYRTPCRPRSGCAPDYGSCNPDKRLCNPDRNCRPNTNCRPAR